MVGMHTSANRNNTVFILYNKHEFISNSPNRSPFLCSFITTQKAILLQCGSFQSFLRFLSSNELVLPWKIMKRIEHLKPIVIQSRVQKSHDYSFQFHLYFQHQSYPRAWSFLQENNSPAYQRAELDGKH